MRIALLLNEFPKLSETFIINQIVGLIERGHTVDIFAYQKGDQQVHPRVEQFQLVSRTQYLNIPTSWKKRAPVAAKHHSEGGLEKAVAFATSDEHFRARQGGNQS